MEVAPSVVEDDDFVIAVCVRIRLEVAEGHRNAVHRLPGDQSLAHTLRDVLQQPDVVADSVRDLFREVNAADNHLSLEDADGDVTKSSTVATMRPWLQAERYISSIKWPLKRTLTRTSFGCSNQNCFNLSFTPSPIVILPVKRSLFSRAINANAAAGSSLWKITRFDWLAELGIKAVP